MSVLGPWALRRGFTGTLLRRVRDVRSSAPARTHARPTRSGADNAGVAYEEWNGQDHGQTDDVPVVDDGVLEGRDELLVQL